MSSDEDWLVDTPSADVPAQHGVVAGASSGAEQSGEDWMDEPIVQAGPAEVALQVEPNGEAEADQPVAEEEAPRIRMTRQEAATNARRQRMAQRAERLAVSACAADATEVAMPSSRLAQLLVDPPRKSIASYLKPAMAHAEECGVARSEFRGHLWAYGQAAYHQMQARGCAPGRSTS